MNFLHYRVQLFVCFFNISGCHLCNLRPQQLMCEVLDRIINSNKSSVLLSLADSSSSLAVTKIPEQLEGQEFPNTMVTSRSNAQVWSPAGKKYLIYPLF